MKIETKNYLKVVEKTWMDVEALKSWMKMVFALLKLKVEWKTWTINEIFEWSLKKTIKTWRKMQLEEE